MYGVAYPTHKYLRDIENVKTEKIKIQLDKFQGLVLDEPKIPKYVTAARSNSILDQLSNCKAQGIYNSGGVSDLVVKEA